MSVGIGGMEWVILGIIACPVIVVLGIVYLVTSRQGPRPPK